MTAVALAMAVPALAQTPAAPPPATTPAAAPAAPAPNYNVQYAGLFDGYYLWQFNDPKGPGLLPGRFYDFRHNAPTLALGELNVFKVPKPGGFGYKTTLGSGDIATINGGGGIEARFQSLMQAYGQYSLGTNGAGIDFGKFYTPIGYEVTESNGNFNETHSVPFAFIPFYHFGVRAYTPSYNGLVLTGYIVQAIYNTSTAGVQNDSKTASFVGNGIWTDPKGKWVVGESLAFGENKFNLVSGNPSGGPKNNTTVSDTDITYNLNPKQIVGFNYTYAKTDPKSNTMGITKATFNGWAGYYKQILGPKTDFALRYSGGTLNPSGGTNFKPWEATATYELHPTSALTWRAEYQHSGANNPAFVDSNDTVTKNSQDTLELAGLFTFSG